MRVVADLHIHSRHSIATSPKLTPDHLDRWARIKGIDLLGTGDCTHPLWLSELRDALEPAEEGLFRLKPELRRGFDMGMALSEGLPEPSGDREPRFALSGEISTIYSRGGRTRKVHHVVLLPDFQAAIAFQARLERTGNIRSDGRPILGLDSRELFSLLLEADDRSVLVPAHIWTPWFSALGERSGFESIKECYGDLADRIGAIETGLSSNPPMNWAVSELDRYSIISNSDAHSPEKLGREATVLSMEMSFSGMAKALSGGGVLETVEFFPQEGKYHWDGHRACKVALSPEAAGDGRCPVCGKPLTPGVLRRVVELADRPVDEAAPCPSQGARSNQRPYRSLIPLKELLGELMGSGEGSKRVSAAYNELIRESGSEFDLLLGMDLSEIARTRAPGVSGELLAEAVGRMREGRVFITPGYDGQYGVIRAFAPGSRLEAKPEAGLFEAGEGPQGEPEPAPNPRPAKPRPRPEAGDVAPKTRAASDIERPAPDTDAFRPDPAQERAVNHPGGPALVIAGPGTGKTSVLTRRIARVVTEGADPASILALTFTNKAAGELRERLDRRLGALSPRIPAAPLTAATFHAFCLSVLREQAASAALPPGFLVLSPEERDAVLEAVLVGRSRARGDRARAPSARRLGSYIEERKRFLLLPGEREPRLGPGAPSGLLDILAEAGPPALDDELDGGYAAYRAALRAAGSLDFDDLVSGTARLLAARPEILSAYRSRYRFVFVDEYQDVNFAQYALLRLLCPGSPGDPSGDGARRPAEGRQLFVIGDPNQAIYAFRGSDSRFMERFRVDYPDATVYTLSRSFRCTPPILDAASRLVESGGTKLGARLEGAAGRAGGVTLWRAEAPTAEAEAEGIAREIDRMIGGTRFFALDSGTAGVEAKAAAERLDTYGRESGEPALLSRGECALLAPAAALPITLLQALRDHGIPYRFTGEVPWWEEEPARAVLRLLRAASRPASAVPSAAPDAPGVDLSRIQALRARLPALSLRPQEVSPSEAVSAAYRVLGTRRPSRGEAEDAADRLQAYAEGFRDLPTFLDALTLGSPQDGPRGEARQNVSVMTIHSAKGLEFDHVFVAGLEEGILPFTLFDKGKPDGDSPRRLAEERRLLYVAITRARIGLHLWRARSRVFKGRPLALPPSRFLAEIEDLVPMMKADPRRKQDPQLGLF